MPRGDHVGALFSEIRVVSAMIGALVNFQKKLSFVGEVGGANELESLRVTCRYDCLEVPHMLVKFRAKKFHFASDHFVRPRVSVLVVKK